MELPISLASSIFAPKGLYYFSSEALNTDEPHYFILVEIEGKVMNGIVSSGNVDKSIVSLIRKTIDEFNK